MITYIQQVPELRRAHGRLGAPAIEFRQGRRPKAGYQKGSVENGRLLFPKMARIERLDFVCRPYPRYVIFNPTRVAREIRRTLE